MKLEKREITLNEFDSLKDVFYGEKSLLLEYARVICKAERKETREFLCQTLASLAKDVCFVGDIMRGASIENE